MKRPPTPPDEAARLSALASYEVLDTGGEPAFDALTELAATILGTPIALVSLVDVDRQWFKSRYGLDVRETPREVSFCGHVVAESAALVVPDTFDDPRFADNPLATGAPHVRFYAGMPLRNPEGFVLGTLCVIDREPRVPTPQQLRMLALLASQVVDQLEARRKHLEALESSKRLQTLFDAMVEGVVVQDRHGTITTVNKAAESILGLSVDQIAGRSSLDPRWKAVHEDGTPFPGETHPSMVALRNGTPSMNVVMGVHKPGGDLTWISINALPLRTANEVITTFHDITIAKGAREAEERLSRQERLVTTGTLAAGVGHEINNPLAYILANIDYSLEEVRAIAGGSPTGRLRELIGVLEEAREGGERIRKIVRGLRAFAREESEPLPTDAASAIDIAVNMAAHETRQKATLVKHLAETPPVLTDESRLAQVLVNLIVNSAQAFPAGGDVQHNRITISTSVEPDGRVCIEVSDNGPGIPAALQRRVFDPFFTTKPPGQGTGLGLSISQSIVTALGGELLLTSALGKGARFRVLLPMAHAGVAGPADEAIEADAPRGGRGRVLVIDDEVAVGRAIQRILGKDHEVIVFHDPREALKQLDAGQRFDVVFCDMAMPGLSGDAVYARVSSIDPDQAERFVFVSGGSIDGRTAAFLAEVPNERVEKPFNVQNLRGIARRYMRSS